MHEWLLGVSDIYCHKWYILSQILYQYIYESEKYNTQYKYYTKLRKTMTLIVREKWKASINPILEKHPFTQSAI